MRAPWAYPDEHFDEDDTVVSAPTWDCPGGSCYCHSKPLVGEHRLFLFDRLGHPMPGARCRVMIGRRELNQRMPFADGRGSVLFAIHGAVGDVTVEWAPSEMPREPEYPYRAHYAAPNLTDDDDDREHVRRRLANLGFSRFSKLDDNVGDFQQALGRPPTRRWQDVALELAVAHDQGLLQPFVDPPSGREGFERQEHLEDDGPLPTNEAELTAPRFGLAARQARGDSDGRDTDPPAVPPPPPSPGSGSVCRPGLASIRFELAIGTPLRPFPKEFLGLVSEARVIFDGSALDPPVAKKQHVATENGALCVGLPPSTGVLTIDILPPPRWVNPNEEPAGPSLTAQSRAAGEAALAALSNRDALFDARRDSETRLVALQKDLTVAGLAHEKAVQSGNQTTIQSAFQALSSANAAVQAEFAVREQHRAAINARSHEANTAYAKATPEFMFRALRFVVLLDRKGRIAGRTQRFQLVDPEIETPIADVSETPGKFRITWFPDWVRAPAYRFSWQQEASRSAFVHPGKGLGGKPCIVVHNTGSKGQPFSSVVNGLTANRVSATSFEAADTDTSVHYIVSRRGHVVKMIDEHYTAFHGDPGIWEGHPFMNFRSVGIEILNSGSESFTELQMRGLLRLIERLKTAFGVERRRVLGHGEINHQGTVLSLAATNRVVGAELNPFDRLLSCPGRRFPWPRLSDRKLTFDRAEDLTSTTTGTTASPDDLRRLKQRLARLGYTVSSDNRPPAELDGNYDEATQRSYTVFQFRWHDAPADRPRRIVTDAPDKETVDAVVAAIDTIQP